MSERPGILLLNRLQGCFTPCLGLYLISAITEKEFHAKCFKSLSNTTKQNINLIESSRTLVKSYCHVFLGFKDLQLKCSPTQENRNTYQLLSFA